jgi:hypothetical protein
VPSPQHQSNLTGASEWAACLTVAAWLERGGIAGMKMQVRVVPRAW